MKYILETTNLNVEITSACDTYEEMVEIVSAEFGITKIQANDLLNRCEKSD